MRYMEKQFHKTKERNQTKDEFSQLPIKKL